MEHQTTRMKEFYPVPRRNTLAASEERSRAFTGGGDPQKDDLFSAFIAESHNSTGSEDFKGQNGTFVVASVNGSAAVASDQKSYMAAAARCADSISCPMDQVVNKTKNVMSDPIGREQDLSSGGPLDDGVGLCLTPCRGPDIFPSTTDVSPTNHSASAFVNNTPARTLGSNDYASSSPDSSSCTHGVLPVGAPFAVDVFPGQVALAAANTFTPSSSVLGTQQTQYRVEPEQPVPFESSGYARKGARSHTSQGIPAHKLRLLLGDSASILEESASEAIALEMAEKERLLEELQLYKERSTQLEEQIKALHSILEIKTQGRIDTMTKDGDLYSAAQSERPWDPSMQTSAGLSGYSPGPLSLPGSVPSMTMSPDLFSPFLAAMPSPQVRTPREVSYGGGEKSPQSTSENELKQTQSALSRSDMRSDEDDGTASAASHSIAEQAYLTGLRVNLSGLELQENAALHPQSFSFAALQDRAQAQHDLKLPKTSSFGSFHSPLLSQMGMRSPYGSPSSSIFPSNLSPSSFRSASGHAAQDERGSRIPASESHIPPEALVARALGAKNQEASIVLQQQLKTANSARKAAIVRAIAPHVLKLADDKHGNFLIQRAINVEPQLAWRLQGRFVMLSLSQFGCHVVQKLLDESEDVRKAIVNELLADRVMETLTCKNSIHIWQKILELRWNDDGEMRAKIFRIVNATMKGKWADTAMLETGSIICQNIFESAEEVEKRECLSEILCRLGECASNQWGVWVVQHIIEHSDAEAKKGAFQQLLCDAASLTLSQYGQKAIMSALKSRDPDFVAAYIDILCDRDTSTTTTTTTTMNGNKSGSTRRSVLVDVSTAPQGVQIVTQLLTSVTPEQRERIIKTVRKNSVFLKGSKAGLRVHQLCERARAFTGY